MKKNLFLALLLITPFITAQANGPVSHQHNGRTHSHVLPGTGVNHTHGQGARQPNQQSNDNGWLLISEGNTTKTYAKKGSFKAENGYFEIVTKTRFKSSNTTEVYKERVSANDCRNEVGQTLTLDLSGKLIATNDFAFGAGNVGSAKAEIICGLAGSLL